MLRVCGLVDIFQRADGGCRRLDVADAVVKLFVHIFHLIGESLSELMHFIFEGRICREDGIDLLDVEQQRLDRIV